MCKMKKPYRVGKTKIKSLRDLKELLLEASTLVCASNVGSPFVKHTAWSDMALGMERVLDGLANLTESELDRPFDYMYPDGYDYDKIHGSTEAERIAKAQKTWGV